ncbi:dolichol-phosphate mannosyltransferase [Actinomadura pelletieri DSM 43383]|uniref:Dolichol-phosphate mannosyltransferase n=1 Tax=Actinomadura pelletieri DSM 43383 TaxID=1120940 RepID=A0A495R055_9ACTN|nr:glycosyltransferase family 2 protein [Actinomadura pelletieri]RKS79875.1 dolichol-phosphate mannosyltransferase [Actinomadura pelletieri DSM 43383]
MRASTAAQTVAALVVAARLARGRNRPPPLTTPPHRRPRPAEPISVVIPARNEEHRIRECVVPLLADPAVREVIVVDDQSRDGTARVAAGLGATVLTGTEPPAGWVGKQWALNQGLHAAKGPVVVQLDADARPRTGLCTALADLLDDCDLISAAPRFITGNGLEQALHASFLTTLVYRFGPIGPAARSTGRLLLNGQCLAFRKDAMTRADGFARVRGHLTDDVALGRLLARDGWRVSFVDAGTLLEVDMHTGTGDVWREWGRSIALRDVTSPIGLTGDLAAVWLTMALPTLRLLAGRPTPLDLALLGQRLLLTIPLRGSYSTPGPGLLLSPLLDAVTAVRLTLSTLRPATTWRGRAYAAPARRERPARSARR